MDSVLRHCDDLSLYVARPRGPSTKNRVEQPLLPTSLTSAFCSSISNYITVAKRLTLINRAEYIGNTKGWSYGNDTVLDLRDSKCEAVQQTLDDLQKARLDIILLHSTRREVNCLRIQSVDIHFLAMVLLHSVHSFTLSGDQGQDIIRTYQKRLSVLRGQASRQPQRRVSLEQGF